MDCGIVRALLDSAGRLVGRDGVLKSLADSVSSGHLVQVSNVLQLTYHAFSRWVVSNCEGRPMSPIEAAIYSYLQFLVLSNRGAPAGSAFLKSIRFLDSCFQYMYTTAAVFSTGRWLGACFVEKATSPRSGLYMFD